MHWEAEINSVYLGTLPDLSELWVVFKCNILRDAEEYDGKRPKSRRDLTVKERWRIPRRLVSLNNEQLYTEKTPSKQFPATFTNTW